MAYEVGKLLDVQGNTIRIAHPSFVGLPKTYLSVAAAAGVTSLTVTDNNNFANANYLVVGKIGVDATEIVRVNAAVTLGTALTSTTTSFAHAIDSPIQLTLWNQVEISGASTLTGSKTVIATVDLMVDRASTSYVVTGSTYAFYFCRYKDSNATTYSAYSDGIAAAGYEPNTVRAVKDEALSMTNQTTGGIITEQMLDKEILHCDLEVWAERRRWSWSYDFDEILGNSAEGNYSVSLPSDISDSNSNKSILMVRLGTEANLGYLDKRQWDQRFEEIAHTTVSTAITASDTSIVLTDTSDFASSGDVQIGADTITYTGNTESTGTLTGCTGVDNNHSVGDDAWQGASYGQPSFYTVFGGKLYFDTPVDADHGLLNIYLSSYKKPTAVNSDNDTLNLLDYTIYHFYIAWKILLRLNNGAETPESQAMKLAYVERKNILKMAERSGQTSTFRPRLNRILSESSSTSLEIVSPHIN